VSLSKRLTRLCEILVALSASPIPSHLFQTLADQAGEALACDYLALCLTDTDGKGYLVHSLVGGASGASPVRPFPLDEGLPGLAIRSGRVILSGDLGAELDHMTELERGWVELGLRAVLIAPVRRGGDVLGALCFAARGPATYTPDDIQVASLMAAGLSAALETSRAYQALADERSTLAAVVGSMQDAVVMANQDGIVLLANPAVRSMLQLEPEAITGLPLPDALTKEPLRALLEAGRPGTGEVALPDGRTAQASVVPVSTPYGEMVGLAAILRDITLLKELENLKDEIVRSVSHDLKNPLTVIYATAQLLLRAGPADPRFATWCERIMKTSDYMTELITDLLDLGKIEAGLERPTEEVDLNPLVADVVATLQPQAEAEDIAITVEMPSQVPVSANPSRIKQALLNLVGNALKYSRPGSSVAIAVSMSHSSHSAGASVPAVVVTLTDTGIGIPAADLPHVFDKFYRVKSQATSEIPGTGLGLAITKSIIEAHGGRIWAESQEGKGSTFAFCLPAGGSLEPS
jgi:two-component system, OmpR family, phosphate regulon sensor histidine kinase PhoR